jgi:drug/metabolite transporter (DMT)-like permease
MSSILWGAVLILPFALGQLPSHPPGWKAFASVAALGVAGTGIAQLLVFRMLRLYGSARTSLVTFLMPPIAVVYGVALLGEPLTAEEIGGMVLILLGVALGAGAVRFPRRTPVTQAP